MPLILLLLLPLIWNLWLCQTATPLDFDPEAAKQVAKTTWQIAWGERQSWYIWINLGTIIFPFLLSFDRKVHFYRKWRFLWPGLLLTAAFFIAWDVYYTHLGVWGFNSRYTSHYILGLPLGEWLFFLTVPYACVFLHECLRCYLPKDPLARFDAPLTWALILGSLFIGLWNYDRIYTSWTFLLLPAMLFWHYRRVPNSYRTWLYLSYAVSLIPFILVNGTLTGAFNQEPVVIYHNAHNLQGWLGQRFITIPFDDFGYGFILLFMNIGFFEFFRERAQKNSTSINN